MFDTVDNLDKCSLSHLVHLLSLRPQHHNPFCRKRNNRFVTRRFIGN